jgi:peptidoglycan/xylan/chitin deacetylase (PgdA/CDA1 family)
VDRLFRYLNRKKILILAYHGITKRKFRIQPWTLLPQERFEQQIKFIKEKYNIITLKQAVAGITNGNRLPENPAVVTFDDGYKNNFTLALPILQKFGVPATIFLTAGYIGSKEILPLDEVYLVITHSKKRSPITLLEIGLGPLFFDSEEALFESYLRTVHILKGFRAEKQKKYITLLKETLDSNHERKDVVEEFLLLSKEEVTTLLGTGLIDIGAHTVSHEILTNISLEEAENEIVESKDIIEKYFGGEINLFAYPNGTESDYNDEHVEYLKRNEFVCSVATVSKLNGVEDDRYRLGRMSIGPDYSSDLSQFALRTSGFISAANSFRSHKHV